MADAISDHRSHVKLPSMEFNPIVLEFRRFSPTKPFGLMYANCIDEQNHKNFICFNIEISQLCHLTAYRCHDTRSIRCHGHIFRIYSPRKLFCRIMACNDDAHHQFLCMMTSATVLLLLLSSQIRAKPKHNRMASNEPKLNYVFVSSLCTTYKDLIKLMNFAFEHQFWTEIGRTKGDGIFIHSTASFFHLSHSVEHRTMRHNESGLR